MSVQVTNITVDATLNPGSGEKDDSASVSISHKITHGSSSGMSVPVSLPSGTIVQDVKKAERSAYDKAAEILTQLAAAARKEALL